MELHASRSTALPLNYMLQHACILSLCTYACDVSDPLPVSKKKKRFLSRGSRLNFKYRQQTFEQHPSCFPSDSYSRFWWPLRRRHICLTHALCISPLLPYLLVFPSDFCEPVQNTPAEYFYLTYFLDIIQSGPKYHLTLDV
jgi:hypothetical protein